MTSMAEMVRNMARYNVFIILLVMVTANYVCSTSEKSATDDKMTENDSMKSEKSSNNEVPGNKFFANWVQTFFGMGTTEISSDLVDEDVTSSLDPNDNTIMQTK